ncbi:hypothetical protein TRIATDRAFT_90318 [Trichoderma atroviride IMI 206040]|uniref:Capsule synthesis protein CapA domain-containing protein n=1 Tax=Hypocrea atroviridis (strain ATCC 20476 / IMI 206040) TaxID=452589 RepID=G9NP53_HYPAI|nr:uncharacterized protein TRIATDRAFT_90318 [Trichoderma atroviride IMI 206040]EHK47838.1 hypothetical protein TRIATDRAFT_90318 [Trichoderma atroviride IMI 206040]
MNPSLANDDTAITEVKIYNTDTQRILYAHVPVDKKSGISIPAGNATIAGVPGTSAPIWKDYKDAISGSRFKGIIPTRRTIDTLNVQGKKVDCPICDVANISVFVRATDVGLMGSELAKYITANAEVIALCKEPRGKAAQLIGMCADWELVHEQSPGLPFVVLITPLTHGAADLTIWNGDGRTRKEMLPKNMHLLMTGDINLLNVDNSTESFRRVVDSLSAADIVISNLECVLGMPEQAYSIQHEEFFANPFDGAEALHLGKIAAVGLANNINYGARNILGSIATLDKAGVPRTGAGANIEAARKSMIIERGVRKYGFLQRTSVY